MDYNSQNYANSLGYILNYTGIVKYYYLDQNSERIDAQFQCKDACFEIDTIGNITWRSGEFINGYWYNGLWYNSYTQNEGQTWNDSQDLISIFRNGIFNNGTWYNGLWYNGTFNIGKWQDGIWYNGIFGYNNLIKQETNQNYKSIWYNGSFYGGIFSGNIWHNGSYYNNSDINSYWLQRRSTNNDFLWKGGYINNVYSSANPIQTLSNNNNYNGYTGIILYAYIHDYQYDIIMFSCSNFSFEISMNGTINASEGSCYNGDFYYSSFNNSTLYNCNLFGCEITDTYITQSQLTNCEITNKTNFIISVSILTSCEHYNGTIQDSVWYDGEWYGGYFINSIWYNGNWRELNNIRSYWLTHSVWYDGEWYGGYIEENYSETAPYIKGNGNSYTNFNGKLSYTYDETTYVISINNADINIEENGELLFTNGIWEDGIFNDGNFINGTWNNGTFNNGYFENSIWNNGTFNNGAIYTSEWNNGIFNNGLFKSSIWNNGEFKGGTFQQSIWNNGEFKGGNWITLNSFWFGGIWLDGLQNDQQPFNYNTQTYVQYIEQNDLQDNIYIIQLQNENIIINVYDSANEKIEIEESQNYEEILNIGYYINDNILYLCFKNGVENYYKLQYSYVLNDVSPKIRLLTDLQDFLSNKEHLVTGQFDYIVNKEDKTLYYSIKVKDANFSIDNGFITWNSGIFVDGIWYDGEWNTFDTLDGLLTIENSQILNKIGNCIWQNGTWMNGNWNFYNSQWLNGNWITGKIDNIESDIAPTFEIGNGKNYANYIGQIRYIYTDVEENKHFGYLKLDDADFKISLDGDITFNKGTVIDGYWYNGYWYGDIWKNGTWENGVWNCGIWYNGIWKNGTWAINKKYDQLLNYRQYAGNYRTIGTTKVNSKLDIPELGFFIAQQQPSNYSYSDSSYIFDSLTEQQYNSLYGYDNQYSLYSNISQNSDISSYSDTDNENQEYIVQIKKWVNSYWVQGFIGNIKSYYAPMYGIANGNNYYNLTDQLVYSASKYDQNNNYLYQQFYFLNFSNATFSVNQNGYIVWRYGQLMNSQFVNGEWINGQFINGTWYNGTWYNGEFTSGTWYNGTWYNGYLTTANTVWHNGNWNNGYIDGFKSQYSPSLKIANGYLFLNYTGQLKYHNSQEYFYMDVSNAYFCVDESGTIIFYRGTWNDGTFNGVASVWKTAKFNQTYNYILDNQQVKLGQEYTRQVSSKTYKYIITINNNRQNVNQYSLDYFEIQKFIENGEQLYQQGQHQIKNVFLFNDTDEYISNWINGVFANGTWKNGEWVDGQWSTDNQNIPIGKWENGIIAGIIQKDAPAYTIVDDIQSEYNFINFTGRIKYKVTRFNEQNYKLSTEFLTFSCKNAFFKIQYINTTKQRKTFKQAVILWEDGIFQNGTFHRGLWHRGTWYNGTWESGIWEDGIWYNGTWICGNWYNGTWKKGNKKHISVFNMIT